MKIQIFTVLILVGIIPVLIFSKVLIRNYRVETISQRISEMKSRGETISKLLVSTGFLTNQEATEVIETNAEITYVADIYDGRIIIVDRGLTIIKDTYGLEEGKILVSEGVIKGLQGVSSEKMDTGNKYMELIIPVTDTGMEEITGVLIISFSVKNVDVIYHILGQKAMLLSVIIGFAVILISAFYSNVLTKPFKRVVGSIDKLSEGYLDEKVSIQGFLEIEQISDSFNRMLSKMQKVEESRQEFVSNVSHELKTPITSIKVLSDSLLSQEEVPVELYREFLEDIADEIDREDKIINDLLSLVKMDKKAGEMNITSININELLEQILKRLRPIAEKRNIELIFESFRPVVAEVDEVKISLAINNLIENAIKYNVDEGWVRVSLNADHKFFYIKVADSGEGIPEEAQDSIFERFYRVDKARSRETGGTGLGLSITRNVILMHRGAIKVYSVEKEGTTFTVRVPLNYIA